MKPDLDGMPLRRAALTVHALPQADRAWVLDSLAPADREGLQDLLAELDELGIPPDPGMLARVPPEFATNQEGTGRWLETLDDAGLSALQRVLAREPSSVTRALLSVRTWTWSARLLAAVDARTRSEVEVQPVSRTTTSHFAEALLKAIGTRMDCEPLPAPARAGRWKRSWDRIRRRA